MCWQYAAPYLIFVYVLASVPGKCWAGWLAAVMYFWFRPFSCFPLISLFCVGSPFPYHVCIAGSGDASRIRTCRCARGRTSIPTSLLASQSQAPVRLRRALRLHKRRTGRACKIDDCQLLYSPWCRETLHGILEPSQAQDNSNHFFKVKSKNMLQTVAIVDDHTAVKVMDSFLVIT